MPDFTSVSPATGAETLAPFPAIVNADERGLDFFVKHGDTIYADIPSPAGPELQAETLTEFRAKHAEVYGTTLGMNSWADLQHIDRDPRDHRRS